MPRAATHKSHPSASNHPYYSPPSSGGTGVISQPPSHDLSATHPQYQNIQQQADVSVAATQTTIKNENALNPSPRTQVRDYSSSEGISKESDMQAIQQNTNPSAYTHVPPAKSLPSSSSAGAPVPPKKKHVCPTCDRGFTTSGHLARHARVHTGERNHKCPFPGCETRCSRQDNLQQQYVIIMSSKC